MDKKSIKYFVESGNWKMSVIITPNEDDTEQDVLYKVATKAVEVVFGVVDIDEMTDYVEFFDSNGKNVITLVGTETPEPFFTVLTFVYREDDKDIANRHIFKSSELAANAGLYKMSGNLQKLEKEVVDIIDKVKKEQP